MSTATLEPTTELHDHADASESLACPHCRKQFQPLVDTTQPPRLQGAKCPHCKLFVPARIVAAALS